MTEPDPLTGRQGRRDGAVERYLELQPLVRDLLDAAVEPELREEFASVTSHQVLALTRLPEQGLPMRQLAAMLRVTAATATVLADRLVARQLATRRQDPRDRRVVLLAPTELGRDLARRAGEARRQAAEAAFARLDDEQVEAWLDVMETLAREADNCIGAPQSPPALEEAR